MSELAAPNQSKSTVWLTRRRFGYIVWLAALGFFFIPEILAASSGIEKRLPFTTLSGMVGHLEYLSPPVEVATTALIVFALISIVRIPPKSTSGGRKKPRDDHKPHRTAGGRITFKLTPHVARSSESFDADEASGWFAVAAVGAALLIAFGTIAARAWWPDGSRKAGETNALFHPGYVLYGSIALFWFVTPSLYAFIAGNDAPFPTLFRTLTNFQDWLHGKGRAGEVIAWLLSFVLIWGLLFLLLHLTLYPFPDITKLLNPTGH